MEKQSEIISQLVEKAKNDPAFFHALVFNADEALKDLKDLDPKVKARIVGLNPDDLLGVITGSISDCGISCSSTCECTSGGSCGYTNLQRDFNQYFSRISGKLNACGNTCSSSCDNTCGSSCGYTTNLTDMNPGNILF